RRVLALHAGHRLKDHLRVSGGLARKVAVHPDPVHLATLRDLDLADDRHIVLALAGDHARVAPDAAVQVDRHPPLTPFIVGTFLPQGEMWRMLLEDAEWAGRRRFLVCWIRSQCGHRRLADERPALHAAVVLRRRQRVLATESGERDPAVESRRPGGPDLERV